MLRTTLLLAFLFALVSCKSSSMKPAAHEPQPIQLFNGTDLTGWTPVFKEPNSKVEDTWSVENGIIKCKGKPAGYIRTNDDYTSYVLKVEWRFSKKGNSGVLVRAQPPDKVWPKSMECQLNSGDAGDIWDIDAFPAKLDPSRTEGRRTRKLEPSSEKPIGEWNVYEITLDGSDLELKVNGVVQNKATDVQVIPGKICLQSEGAEIEFRKVELTPIASRGPSETATRLPGLKGWHVIGNGNWTYKNGIIDGQQTKDVKTYTHVVSDKSYRDLRATLKFKAIQGNSGFYIRSMVDDKGLMHGIQCEIDETRDAGGLYESYGRNWLVNPDDAENAKYFKPQDWNQMTVEVRGNHIVTHVNGAKVADFVDDKQRMEGVCALQIHGGQDVHVQFKDIKIKSLD